MKSIKYRALFLTCYAAGLRISEACSLRYVTIVSIIMAIFNVAVNLALIPIYGPLGAAAATFATELLALILFAGYLQKHFPGLFDGSGLLRLAAGHGAALIAGCFIWEQGWAARILYLLVYGALTALVLVRLRIRNRDDEELAVT